MSALNAKLMNEKLKRGWTPADFARHLDMSENDFLNSLQKLLCLKTYNGWCSELRTNQKRKELNVSLQKQKESLLLLKDEIKKDKKK